jgi:hypothetical protein
MGRIDLAGKQFDRLTVIGFGGLDKHCNSLWTCQCICGKLTTVIAGNLKCGRSRSCGCLNSETRSLRVTTHGHNRSNKQSPTYKSWSAMIQRCANPKAKSYDRYGEAGVTVTPEWMTFEGFLASMGERPKGTTLGRILDSGNYEPGNAFYQTDAEQKLAARNKRALQLYFS